MKLKILFRRALSTSVLLIWATVVQAVEEYPLEYFALRASMTSVSVSPSGNKLAMLKILSREGNPYLHIYDAEDLGKKPYVVGSEKMEITGYNWADENYIIVTFRQKVEDKVQGA